MELTVEYIPALIVAKKKDGSYVKISESKKDEIYYCPVCGGEVKSRAVNSDKVQPHFYHTSETNCSNESILHWMFKNWLFEVGSKFIIDKDEFIVSRFEMEEPIETPFGEYRPDLTIYTNKEDFYFEINYSSSKDKTFADKWSHLGKRVIEVNVRELINSELYETTPIFKTIFENGQYTKEYKQYERKDKYVEFKTFVLDSNTENKIKDVAEKFDWFWREISKEKEDDNIVNSLECMEYSDAVNCTKFLKKIKCHDKFKLCKDKMLERAYKEMKKIINDEDYFVDIKKVSAQIYEIYIYHIIMDKKIGCDKYKIRTFDDTISYAQLYSAYKSIFKRTKDKCEWVKRKLKEVDNLKIGEKNIEKSVNIWRSERDDYVRIELYLLINIYSEYCKKWIQVYNREIDSKFSDIQQESIKCLEYREREEKEKRMNEEIFEEFSKKENINNINEKISKISDSLKIKAKKYSIDIPKIEMTNNV